MADDAELGGVAVERLGSDVAVVRLLGEHDLSTTPRLRRTLGDLAAEGRSLVVDVTETEFLDSSVLNALYERRRNGNHGLALQMGTASIVRRALEIGGLLELVPCGEDREEAIRLARR